MKMGNQTEGKKTINGKKTLSFNLPTGAGEQRAPPSPEIQEMLRPSTPPEIGRMDGTDMVLNDGKAMLLATIIAPDEHQMSLMMNSHSNIDTTEDAQDSVLPPIPGVEQKKNNESSRFNSKDKTVLPPILEPTAKTKKAAIISKGGEKLSGKERFRRVARMVKTNLSWAKDVREHNEEENTFTVKGDESEHLVFNVNNFKISHNAYGGLSPRVKVILANPPAERSATDVALLTDVVRRLKCFDKYSSAAKQELARIIYYEKFEEGRVVIQEGHIGFSFYFIVSGVVNVLVAEVNKITGEKRSMHLGELCEGASFGELALLHNIRRTATIICKTFCEFLRVDKTDFESVLRTVTNAEYERRLAIMKEFPAFSDWSLQEIQDANYATRIKECPPDVILSATLDSTDNFYVIICGDCLMVRELYVLKENIPWGGYRLRLPTEAQLVKLKEIIKLGDRRATMRRRSVTGMIPERRLWTVGRLGRFNYFGVGETFKDTHIVSRTKVDLLVVPKLLFSKLGRSRSLDKMRDLLNKLLPDNQQLFEEYHTDLNWRRYKAQVVKEIIQRRSQTTCTDIKDVPEFIRSAQAYQDRV